jgi:hypothetical protein
MTLYIVPIIEGQTEAGCVERLLHRLWNELVVASERLQVLPPSRSSRDGLVHPDGVNLGTKIEEAFAKVTQYLHRDSSGRGLLLLLLDAEGDCPRELAPALLQRCQRARSDADISCVVAKRMLENWFVSAAGSLAGKNGLPTDLQMPDQPEERSGARWLAEQIRSVDRQRTYKKTVDAKLYVGVMDLRLCRENSPSFDKLCRELERRAASV